MANKSEVRPMKDRLFGKFDDPTAHGKAGPTGETHTSSSYDLTPTSDDLTPSSRGLTAGSRIGLILATILIPLFLTACSDHTSPKHRKTYTVKKEEIHKSLFFTGTIKPLKQSTISSPMEATLETMVVHYGQPVKKGELIGTLHSTELQKQFNDILTEYLKAKDNLTVTNSRFVGTQDLWNAGLISKNNYLSEKSGLATARISLMQASRKLSEILEKIDDQSKKDISSLNIAEFDKVQRTLSVEHNTIKVKAPTSGLLLYPPQSSEDKTTKITIGSALKSGQILALVGDISGISIEIDIPEIDIGKINPGMKARISGTALGKEIFEGILVAVTPQASTSSSNGLPTFGGVVEVRNLSPEQQAWIKIGMSASIELILDNKPQLAVPIVAIKQEKGVSLVQIQQANGELKNQVVATGSSQADKVIIESGLKEGDVVVYG
jgi:multidrug efflux pump subunit AcrA (membrane-fusion protein)